MSKDVEKKKGQEVTGDHVLCGRVTEVESRLDQLRTFTLESFDRLEEIQALYRAMLDEVECIYHENETAFQDLKQIRHKMIGARTFSELVQVTIREIRNLDVDHVSICLVREMIDQHAASGLVLPEGAMEHLLLPGRSELAPLFTSDNGYSTYIGEVQDPDHSMLCGPKAASCVLAPLTFRDELIGSLNLGSVSPERFTADQCTDLIDDLAVTAALCIDSVLTHERNERLATTDPLTGCYNRRYFYRFAANEMNLARRHGDNLACIYIDLNDFKPINDQYGHDAGDLVLKRFVAYLRQRLRKTDILARMGGDEFAVLLLRESLESASNLVHILKTGVEALSFDDDGLPGLCLSAAMGVAGLEPADATVEHFVLRADQSMFLDKGEKKR